MSSETNNFETSDLTAPNSVLPASKETLHDLSTDILELFYAQAIAPEEFPDEPTVCREFSTVLLRYWHLCSLTTFLDDGNGQLRDCGIYVDKHVNRDKSLATATLLARIVKESKHEYEVWLADDGDARGDAKRVKAARSNGDREDGGDAETSVVRIKRFVAEAGMRAAFAVPIHVRGRMVGSLVALTNSPPDLREAQHGMRYIAAPMLIAVSNVRRAAALGEHRTRIERLIEELQMHGHALEEANRELRRVARYRSLFLARMSHELRTPLTSILGFAEILLDQEDLTDAQRRFCEKIQASGLQQQESLTQLVDLSRLEAGQSELFLHEFSLREVVRGSCAAVARLARKGEVTVERRVEANVSTIVSDEGKLRQVLYNFLAFAINRTPAGGRVEVSAEQFDSRFRVEITDEGEPLSDPQHIFEPLDTEEEVAVSNERGTNMNELGLVIAHRLVAVLGGTLELEDLKPHGLRVRLKFPASPTENGGQRSEVGGQ